MNPETRSNEQPKFVIVGEWLAMECGECTCGTGSTSYGHERGCGLEPLVKLADIEALRERTEAAEAALARVTVLIWAREQLIARKGYNDGCMSHLAVADVRAALAAAVPTPEEPEGGGGGWRQRASGSAPAAIRLTPEGTDGDGNRRYRLTPAPTPEEPE